jgi:hypothetical protein
MEVSCQLHALAALPRGKSLRYPLDSGPQSWSLNCGVRKNINNEINMCWLDYYMRCTCFVVLNLPLNSQKCSSHNISRSESIKNHVTKMKAEFSRHVAFSAWGGIAQSGKCLLRTGRAEFRYRRGHHIYLLHHIQTVFGVEVACNLVSIGSFLLWGENSRRVNLTVGLNLVPRLGMHEYLN